MSIPCPVYVLSSINDDVILRVRNLPKPGETAPSSSLVHALGGKGANTAVAASKALSILSPLSGDGSVHFVGAVGDDMTGASLLERLYADHHVGVEYVKRIANTETGQAIIFVDDLGENCIVVHAGSNASVNVNMIKEAIEKEQTIHNVQTTKLNMIVAFHFEIPIKTVCAAAEYIKQIGGTVVLNASPVPQSTSEVLNSEDNDNDFKLWSNVDVLIVNEGELSSLCAQAGFNGQKESNEDEDNNILQCIQFLRDGLHAKNASVIVTLGVRGAVLVKEGEQEVRRVKAVSVNPDKVIDTTGAGDCLTGYMCAGVARGWDAEKALQVAVAASALCVQRKGAAGAMPSFDEVRKMLLTLGREIS